MFNKMSKLSYKLKNDRGAIGTVEFLFLILILLFLVFVILDFGLFFANKVVITNAVQNGARFVAVIGGNTETAIMSKYGQTSIPSDCRSGKGVQSAVYGYGACAVYKELAQARLTKNVTIKSIRCTPSRVQNIGETVSCEVRWGYKSLSGMIKGFPNMITRAGATSEVVIKR